MSNEELTYLTRVNDERDKKERTRDLIVDFHRDLNELNWPKVLYVKDGKTFQDLVVALNVEVDWHFEENNEGFAYFVIGPTQVRVDNQGQTTSAQLISFADGFAKAAKKGLSNFEKMIDEGSPAPTYDEENNARQ